MIYANHLELIWLSAVSVVWSVLQWTLVGNQGQPPGVVHFSGVLLKRIFPSIKVDFGCKNYYRKSLTTQNMCPVYKTFRQSPKNQ
jgi:hypothetical protein